MLPKGLFVQESVLKWISKDRTENTHCWSILNIWKQNDARDASVVACNSQLKLYLPSVIYRPYITGLKRIVNNANNFLLLSIHLSHLLWWNLCWLRYDACNSKREDEKRKMIVTFYFLTSSSILDVSTVMFFVFHHRCNLQERVLFNDMKIDVFWNANEITLLCIKFTTRSWE